VTHTGNTFEKLHITIASQIVNQPT